MLDTQKSTESEDSEYARDYLPGSHLSNTYPEFTCVPVQREKSAVLAKSRSVDIIGKKACYF